VVEPEREEVVEEEIFSLQSSADVRDLTQQDGWKTQEGSMTIECCGRPGMHSLARHSFVILPS